MPTLPSQVDPSWRPQPDLVENSVIVQIRPVSSLSGSNRVEFVLPKYPGHCIDLAATKLGIEYQIVKENGTTATVTAGKYLSNINSPLDTIFSQISIAVNGEMISNNSNNHILSFFSNNLNYSAEYRRSILYSNRYYEATAGNEGKSTSKSTQALAALVKDSKKCKCIGSFPHSFFKTPKLLLPNTEVAVTLTQINSDLFILSDLTDKLKVVLTDVFMQLRLIKIDEKIASSIHENLNKSPYIIPFKQTVVKTYTMPAAETGFKVYNAFNGALPSRIFCLQMPTASYLGSVQSCPLVFVHNELKSYSISYNGISIPLQKIDFEMPSDGVQLYHHINTVLNLNTNQISPGITFEKYSSDFFFIAENLLSDCSVNNSTLPFTPGSINICLEFSKALTANSTLIIVGEYAQSFVSIDKSGSVKMVER